MLTEGVVATDEVRAAFADGVAVVALESSPVAHSFAAPGGQEIAIAIEGAVRAQGAVPATVAVADGTIRIGLEDADLERFDVAGAAVDKLGPRDIAACLAAGGLGATTIGATLTLAGLTGIRFTAASGLGGVHRGFAHHLDVSADLTELARTPVMVVASGVKSILDVTATAELLETLSIPVLGWRTDTLPRYYSAHGGPAVSHRVESAHQAASLARHHWVSLAQPGGLLLGLPPAEEVAGVDAVIDEALEAAAESGVTGKAVTPFVLGRVHRATGGQTAEASKRLMVDNARLAAEVAVAYAASCS